MGQNAAHRIAFGNLFHSGVRDLLISCADYQCSHSTRISAEQWSDDVRLSDLEPLLACTACGKISADVRL